MENQDVKQDPEEHTEEIIDEQPQTDSTDSKSTGPTVIHSNSCTFPSTSTGLAGPEVVKFFRYMPLSVSSSSIDSDQKSEDVHFEDLDSYENVFIMENEDVKQDPEEHTEEIIDEQPQTDSTDSKSTGTTVIHSNSCTFPSTSTGLAAPAVEEFFRYIPRSESSSSIDSDQKSEDVDDLDDLDGCLEREAVQRKYDSIYRRAHSCSCIQDLNRSRSLDSIQSYDSWIIFSKWLASFEQPQYNNEACEFCKSSTATPKRSLEIKFAEAEKTLSQYPHYWRHLNQKYRTTISSDIFIKETARKNMLIKSCKRLLQEERRYCTGRNRRIIGENTRIRFDGKMSNLNSDFKTACIYMRDEYPLLLVHLIKKLELTKFDIEKNQVDGIKQRIVELAEQSEEKLQELEKRYQEMEEQGPSSSRQENKK